MKEHNKAEPTPVDQHVQDLINASIDGEISAAEQRELDFQLDSSESVRHLDEQLRTTAKLLDELPVIEPPPYLQSSIERQVRLPADGAKRRNPRVPGQWLGSQWLRTGLALAAGVVLTVGVYEMGSRPIPTGDVENLSGTMVKKAATDQQGKLLDSILLDTEQFSGLVELRNQDDVFTLDVHLNSVDPVEVVMDIDGRGLNFDGATHTQDPEDAISVRDGAIHLASSGGNHFTVKLKGTSDLQHDEPIELDFFVKDQLVKKAELTFTRF